MSGRSVVIIAATIEKFNPDEKTFNHVKIGLNEPLPQSPSGLTWRDIQKLAIHVLTPRHVKATRT